MKSTYHHKFQLTAWLTLTSLFCGLPLQGTGLVWANNVMEMAPPSPDMPANHGVQNGSAGEWYEVMVSDGADIASGAGGDREYLNGGWYRETVWKPDGGYVQTLYNASGYRSKVMSYSNSGELTAEANYFAKKTSMEELSSKVLYNGDYKTVYTYRDGKVTEATQYKYKGTGVKNHYNGSIIAKVTVDSRNGRVSSDRFAADGSERLVERLNGNGRTTYDYHANGRISRISEYNISGAPKTRTEQNSDGYETRKVVYLDGVEADVTERDYHPGSPSSVIKELRRSVNGAPVLRQTFGSNGKPLIAETLGAGGVVLSKTVNSYRADGITLEKIETFGEGGALVETRKFSRQIMTVPTGRMTSGPRPSPVMRTDTVTTEETLDGSGVQIRLLQVTVFGDTNHTQTVVRSLTADGILTDTVVVNASGAVVKEQHLDASGKEIGKTVLTLANGDRQVTERSLMSGEMMAVVTTTTASGQPVSTVLMAADGKLRVAIGTQTVVNAAQDILGGRVWDIFTGLTTVDMSKSSANYHADGSLKQLVLKNSQGVTVMNLVVTGNTAEGTINGYRGVFEKDANGRVSSTIYASGGSYTKRDGAGREEVYNVGTQRIKIWNSDGPVLYQEFDLRRQPGFQKTREWFAAPDMFGAIGYEYDVWGRAITTYLPARDADSRSKPTDLLLTKKYATATGAPPQLFADMNITFNAENKVPPTRISTTYQYDGDESNPALRSLKLTDTVRESFIKSPVSTFRPVTANIVTKVINYKNATLAGGGYEQYANTVMAYDVKLDADGKLVSYSPVGLLDCKTSDCLEQSVNVLSGWGTDVDPRTVKVAVIESASSNTTLDSNHLYYIAGEIGGVVSGAANFRTYNPLSDSWILTYSGAGSSDIANRIRDAVKDGAGVINLSIDFDTTAYTPEQLVLVRADLQAAVDEALGKDVIVVAAAGNGGAGKLGLLTGLKGVISVGSITPAMLRNASSGSGEELDFVAQGSGAISKVSPTGMATWSGTSFAAPIVTAVVVKMVGYFQAVKEQLRDVWGKVNARLGYSQIFSFLRDSAIDLGSVGHDEFFGWGLVDGFGAMQLLRSWLGNLVQVALAPSESASEPSLS